MKNCLICNFQMNESKVIFDEYEICNNCYDKYQKLKSNEISFDELFTDDTSAEIMEKIINDTQPKYDTPINQNFSVEIKKPKKYRVWINALIWLGCCLCGSIITTAIRMSGIILGAIPTLIIWGIILFVGYILSKKYKDSRK